MFLIFCFLIFLIPPLTSWTRTSREKFALKLAGMEKLKEDPNLIDFQEYIKLLSEERGWDKNNPLEIFLLFSEEIGELAKAIRNKMKLYHEPGKKVIPNELADEFVDVFSYLLDLANQFDIDLETAFRTKEEKNLKRIWINKK